MHSMERNNNRIALWGLVIGLGTLAIYWLSAHSADALVGSHSPLVAVLQAIGADAWVSWNTRTALVLGAIGVAAGAAIGSGQTLRGWSTWESVLAAVLAGVTGVLFWAWGLGWNLLDVIQTAIPGYGIAVRDLFYGFWFLAALLVPYIIRRPGAAVAAEVVAAIVSSLLGSQWGLTVLISGLAQGGLAEVIFALGGYKRYGTSTLLLAAGAAALGSWVIDYAFWYNTLELPILLLMLASRLISAGVFSALLGQGLAEALVRAGVLDNTELGRQRMQG